MGEKAWQERVVDTARVYGWTVFHWPDSRRALSPGWPDLVLLRAPEVVFAELKTARGRVSPEQEQTLAELEASGCEVHVWRPGDWDAVWDRLKP